MVGERAGARGKCTNPRLQTQLGAGQKSASATCACWRGGPSTGLAILRISVLGSYLLGRPAGFALLRPALDPLYETRQNAFGRRGARRHGAEGRVVGKEGMLVPQIGDWDSIAFVCKSTQGEDVAVLLCISNGLFNSRVGQVLHCRPQDITQAEWKSGLGLGLVSRIEKRKR